MFTYVSIWGVILATVAAMVIGMLWYAPFMFGKQVQKALNTNDKQMKERQGAAMVVLISSALLTAFALSYVTVYVHSYLGGSGLVAGLRASLIGAIGFGVTTVFVFGAFDPRETKLLYINAGNRLVTLVAMGLIIGAFVK